MLFLFIVFGVIPVNFIVVGLRKWGVPYWVRVISGVIYLFIITRALDIYLI